MSNHPFRLYGDDASDWYEPPHQFEVQLSRAPSEDERRRMAVIWGAQGTRDADPWSWSERFFVMGIDTPHYERSMGVARSVLSAVHEVCPIVDVTCWGTRAPEGPWTAWSVQQQPRPDPGPDHPDLARDVLFWPREVDPSLPAPAQDPAFDDALEALRRDEGLKSLRDAVEANAALELVSIDKVFVAPSPAEWPEEHAHHRDHSETGDTELRWSIPAVVRRQGNRWQALLYVWKGQFHCVEPGFDFRAGTLDEAAGRAWFTIGSELHELTLETGEHRPVWTRESNDYSFWGSTLVGEGDHRTLVVATAVRMVCFSAGAGELAQTSSTRRKYPAIDSLLGGRLLGVRGDAGLAFFIPAAGKLQQVATLRKAKAFFDNDPERVLLHQAKCCFELRGLVALVEAKEAARDKKAKRKSS